MVFHATENIILSFFWELKDYLSWFLKYHASFVNTKERSFYQPPALKKIYFYSMKSIISTFLHPKNSYYELLLSCKIHVFVIFFFSFIETYVSFNHFNDLLNLYYKKKYEAKLRNIFFSEFPMVTAWYMTILVALEIPWNRIWSFNFT